MHYYLLISTSNLYNMNMQLLLLLFIVSLLITIINCNTIHPHVESEVGVV